MTRKESFARKIMDAISATQLAGGITFFQNFSSMLNNGVPAQSDYDATLNTLRNDI